MVKIRIDVHYTYFKVSVDKISAELNIALDPIKKYLTDMSVTYLKNGRKSVTINSKIYHQNDEELFYIFPITLLQSVCLALKRHFNLNPEDISYHHTRKFKDFKFNIKDTYKLRDYQELYLDTIVNEKSPPFVLIDLKPGAGKTFISVNAVQKLGKKIAIVILPKYIEKWKEDIALYTDIKEDRIYVVSGSESIKNVLDNDLDYDIYIISIRTFFNYINSYESEKNVVSPTKVFEKMGVGILLSDESHQETSALTRIVMYSNVEKVIGLSATYIGTTPQDTRIQNTLFPPEVRVSNLVKFDTYIDIVEVGYVINTKQHLRFQNKYGYSHIKYEQSISRFKGLKESYYNMIIYYLSEYFLRVRKKEDKCVIFFATIDMCTDMRKYLKSVSPRGLKINRYVGEDSYEDLMSGDIIITTLKSAGTAVDIPNLTLVINTVIVGSPKLNIQATGRLRKLNNKTAHYLYFYNRHIGAQKRLTFARDKAIRHMAKSYLKKDHHEPLRM